MSCREGRNKKSWRRAKEGGKAWTVALFETFLSFNQTMNRGGKIYNRYMTPQIFRISAKTFRVAMLPCYHGFSDSDLCVLRKYWTILKSCKNDRIKVDSAKKCDILSRSLEPPFWVVRLFQKRRLYFSKAECWNLCWEILLILRIMLGAVLEDNCVIVGRALHPLFYHSTKLTITKFWSLLVQKLEIKFAFVPG